MSEQLSQELSVRLNKLGVVVESVLHHSVDNLGIWSLTFGMHADINFPGPTFTEIWKVLPGGIENKQWLYQKKIAMPRRTQLWYGHINGSQHSHKEPVEAAGMLLIWLAENGHLKGNIYAN